MNCALFFSDECPKYIIPDEELDGEPNSPLISFSVYTYQIRCEKNGILPNGPFLCKLREEDYYMQNCIIKSPTYVHNKHL